MSRPPRANVDTYGFEWPKDFNHEQYDQFMSKYLPVLSRRAQKWEKLLNSKQGFRKSNKVKRYVRKGIPSSHRAVIWLIISGAKEMKEQQPDLYTTILRGPMKQEIIETISLDIPRTFPDNIYFKGTSDDSKRESLKNVLLAFAHHNPSIGYCQGLNFIAGIMLLVTDNEDMTFWLLQSLKERILPDYYTKEMTGLLTDIGVLEELIK
ncbi:growth hormone-regulated TBC protein 1-like [Stegodyphus dumicola]|uniref:growth hormone-regulated TBC protein 1-like n=1 Tax=Stegodyphus dumicola TaxID=202533 RepID=UPI0015AEDEF9|nr:growth hormone-regulated TBC protein 1-like [Stegodyphus dumicola]